MPWFEVGFSLDLIPVFLDNLGMRPNRPGQLFVEDLEKLSRNTKLVLRAVGRGPMIVQFLYLTRITVVEWSPIQRENVWVQVKFEDRARTFSCFHFGVMPNEEGIWERDAWVELAEPILNIRWQEFGF